MNFLLTRLCYLLLHFSCLCFYVIGIILGLLNFDVGIISIVKISIFITFDTICEILKFREFLTYKIVFQILVGPCLEFLGESLSESSVWYPGRFLLNWDILLGGLLNCFSCFSSYFLGSVDSSSE